MSRYIDAELLKRRMNETLGDPETGDMGKLLNVIIAGCIDEIPTADVRENVRGEWKKEIRHYKGNDQEYDYYVIKCSQCGARPQKAWELTNFCPNCGADMRGEKDETD